MAVNNSLQSRSGGKPKFSVAIQTPMYQKPVNDTLGDPDRARRFVAAISSAVAVNPSLQECDAGTVLTAALLGESLNPSPPRSSASITWSPTRTRSAAPWPSSSSATRATSSLQSAAANTWTSTRFPWWRASTEAGTASPAAPSWSSWRTTETGRAAPWWATTPTSS
ncbi:MAG: hypothetical protein V8R77_05370 [Dysosmobacter welbionis]